MHIGHVVAASLHRGTGIHIYIYIYSATGGSGGGGGGGIPRIGVFLHSSSRRYNTE